MSALIISVATTVALSMLCIAACLATFRMMRGPRAQDRILAMDTLSCIFMLMVLTWGIKTGNPNYFPIAVIIAIAGFVSTAALAKFLMRGEIME